MARPRYAVVSRGQWQARGRQQLFSDASIQFCLSLKCLFNLPLRQDLGPVQSLLHLASPSLNWPVPDYSNTKMHCLKRLGERVMARTCSSVR